MINELFQVGEIAYATAQREYDLLRGVNHHEIRLRIEGEIDIAAGGGADGVILDDAVARLIDEARIVRDGVEIMQPLTGRDLLALTRRSVVQMVEPTEPATTAVASTAFRADIVIPLSPRFLANPVEVALVSRAISNSFRLYIRFNTDRNATGDDAGTGAFVSGGTRAVTWTTEPRIYVTEVYSVGNINSWYEPRLYADVSDQFTAATPRLPYDVISQDRILGSLFMAQEGADAAPADIINNITFRSGTTQIIPAMPYEDLKAMETNLFPAVALTDPGLFYQFAAGGKLGNVLNPQRLQQPRITFDVDAPATSPGIIRVLNFGVVPTGNRPSLGEGAKAAAAGRR